MPRALRIVVPGVPHHVTQRGNHQKALFFSYNDRLEYYSILKKQCIRAGLAILGYCLMNNHVHLIAIPDDEDSLASAIGHAHGLYSRAMNLHKKVTGHIWERRYYSCPMDESHFVRAILYVDWNPVRAGLVKKPDQWQWSSAKAHAGDADPAGLIDPHEWRILSDKIGWQDLMEMYDPSEDIQTIRHYTKTGKPLGDERFVRGIEEWLGYPVTRNRVGRPKKRKD